MPLPTEFGRAKCAVPLVPPPLTKFAPGQIPSDHQRATSARFQAHRMIDRNEYRRDLERELWGPHPHAWDTDRVRGPPERAGMAAGARVTER